MNKNTTQWVAYALVSIGGLNWGLVGFFDYNLVDSIFSAGSGAARVVYAAVGLATLYYMYTGSVKTKGE